MDKRKLKKKLFYEHVRKYYHRISQKKWRENNPNRYKEKYPNGSRNDYYKKYGQENKNKIRQTKQKYREKNKEILYENNKKYFMENKERINETAQKRRLKNPEYFLNKNFKYLKKYALKFNVSVPTYNFSLNNWSKTVRFNNGNYCAICGSTDKLNSHHIFSKHTYPLLSLNPNNGVPLCKLHHNEIHRLNVC